MTCATQRQAKELLNHDYPNLHSRELLKLHRNGLSKVISLLRGHCFLKRHLNVIDITNDLHAVVVNLGKKLIGTFYVTVSSFWLIDEHLGLHLFQPVRVAEYPYMLISFADLCFN